MSRRRYRNKLGVSAWLVTWESARPLDRGKVAAVLRPQTGAEHVRRVVETLYAQSEYSLDEQIRWAIRPKENPYPAQFASFDGARWLGRIYCGHDPSLFARLVDELRLDSASASEPQPIWVERPIPDRLEPYRP